MIWKISNFYVIIISINYNLSIWDKCFSWICRDRKTNEIYIDAKTTLGRTKVNNCYQKSDVTLTIKNQCGDIEIDN